jgi:hypothetical protein
LDFEVRSALLKAVQLPGFNQGIDKRYRCQVLWKARIGAEQDFDRFDELAVDRNFGIIGIRVVY